MTLKQLVIYIAIVLGLLTPALALAQDYGTPVNTPAVNATTQVNTTAQVNTPAASTGVTTSVKITAAQATLKIRGDNEIDRRITALTSLNTRVGTMQKVTDSFKQTLSANITTEGSNLTALKAKIDADTDGTTLKADLKSVTDSYRVYALILPQARIAAAADREVALVSMMSTLGAKLQARVQAVQQGGADVSALQVALSDMAAKITDAQTQGTASVTTSASLTPDNGVAATMASNAAALKTARADLKAAQTDLVGARKDVATILAGLKTAGASANASSTTQVQTH